MNKNGDTLKDRRNYVKKRAFKAKNTTNEVSKIAKRLFLSEATVWKDLLSD